MENTHDLLKFGTLGISNVPISILISKIILYQIFTNCWAQIGLKEKYA